MEAFSIFPQTIRQSYWLITWGRMNMKGVITKPESQKWLSFKLKKKKKEFVKKENSDADLQSKFLSLHF